MTRFHRQSIQADSKAAYLVDRDWQQAEGADHVLLVLQQPLLLVVKAELFVRRARADLGQGTAWYTSVPCKIGTMYRYTVMYPTWKHYYFRQCCPAVLCKYCQAEVNGFFFFFSSFFSPMFSP